MNKSIIKSFTRTVAIAASLGLATTAVADDTIRVYVVKAKKGEIVAPVARDAGFVTRSLAKLFGVRTPKGKTSVVEIEMPAAVWEASKLDVAEIVAKRRLSVVVVDDDPKLGSGWADGLSIKDRHAMALAQQVEVDVSLPGRNIAELARQAMIDDMNARIAGAAYRHGRGGHTAKPSEDKESTGLRPGKFDIDFGPGGAPIEIDCEDPANVDEDVCQLSEHDGDTDPAPNDGDDDGEGSDLPFDPRDCDPFVDAECGSSDPCSLGLAPGNPLADVLGCGFLDTIEAGAIGPRTNDGEEPVYEVTWESIEWNEGDMTCISDTVDSDTCIGSGTIVHEDDDKVCRMECAQIVCSLTQTDEGEERVCEAALCEENECL